ncbi:hypothetical protein FACS1894132_03370 [Clostridia bacterium]|nr:hypothetical protein FACS1894132_03370 [Clostridia bacterium]
MPKMLQGEAETAQIKKVKTETVQNKKAYQALYRKWRPQTFDDVIAQPHIVTTLKNQLANDKTAHAYLFTGSRGTGKTSCARILAKAINCLHPNGANPCLKCENCSDADNASLSDIVEIDAASNNSVDDVRDLRNSTAYTPERCPYKVFIIDEVHMLSISAFNALLKIMEEPPEYVKFILATTEVHKVPITILSRCQRYDFRRILPENIADRLDYVAKQEGFTLERDASLLIATLADGGMRDALSLLDRCTAISDNITSETVTNAAGIGSRQELFQIISAVISHNTSQAISVISALYNASKDMTRLCEELTLQLRNLMLLQIDINQTSLLSYCLPAEILQLQNISKTINIHETLRMLDCLQRCSENLSRVPNKRVEFEMCIVNMCTLPVLQGVPQLAPQGISQAVSQIPNQVVSPVPYPVQSAQVLSLQQNQPILPPQQTQSVLPSPSQSQSVSPTVSSTDAQLTNGEAVTQWNEILNVYFAKDKGGATLIANSKAIYSQYNKETIITIIVEKAIAKEYFNTEERKFKLKQSVIQVLGKEYKIILKVKEIVASAETLINRAKIENLDIEIEN